MFDVDDETDLEDLAGRIQASCQESGFGKHEVRALDAQHREIETYAVGCAPRTKCCNGGSSDVVLDSPVGATLQLGGLGCNGDDSQLCCDVLAHGQWVLASGRLRAHPFSRPDFIRWHLKMPQFALVAEASQEP